MTDVKWDGINEFRRFLKETPKIVAADIESALYEEGENIMGESKRDTPVDTGRLRSTGHVKPPKTTSSKTVVMLAYGTDYAVFVHEIPAQHNVGSAKYLERAMKAQQRGLPERLRKRILLSIQKRAAL